MRLRIRWLAYLSFARFRPTVGLLDKASIKLRVLPNDVDVRLVTNDRYFSYMDIGRHDLITRIGLLGKLRKGATIPLVRSQFIRYRHAARLFQSIELRSRVVFWHENTVWFEQEFFSHDRSIALAYCQIDLRSKAGARPMEELLAIAGHADATSPEPPPAVAALIAQEQSMRQVQREHSVEAPAS